MAAKWQLSIPAYYISLAEYYGKNYKGTILPSWYDQSTWQSEKDTILSNSFTKQVHFAANPECCLTSTKRKYVLLYVIFNFLAANYKTI